MQSHKTSKHFISKIFQNLSEPAYEPTPNISKYEKI